MIHKGELKIEEPNNKKYDFFQIKIIFPTSKFFTNQWPVIVYNYRIYRIDSGQNIRCPDTIVRALTTLC